MERWPQRRALDGEVLDHGEERRAQRVPGGIRRPKLAGWMRKKETELELAWLRRWSTTATMRAHRSSGGGVGKTEKEERKNGDDV